MATKYALSLQVVSRVLPIFCTRLVRSVACINFRNKLFARIDIVRETMSLQTHKVFICLRKTFNNELTVNSIPLLDRLEPDHSPFRFDNKNIAVEKEQCEF